MCGIAGIIDPITPPNRTLLKRMELFLKKRGPDDTGIFLQEDIGLLHCRLAIVDIEGGHQPMFHQDNRIGIVFNGEIYGYKTLRNDLIAQGHTFQTVSDTEVLLHLYERYGAKMIHDLNGMFAFAIVNFERKEVFLARDRFGKKPLFYTHSGGGRFAFSSSLSALTSLPWVHPVIDSKAIDHYLEYQYVPTPNTIYQGIYKLPPGHTAVWQEQQLHQECYWTPELTSVYQGTYSEAKAQLRHTLHEAVRKRLVADVPIGLFLSGGVDSSLICALAQQEHSQPVQTFSIGFPEKKYDERSYAMLVSRFLGTEHHFLEVHPNDFHHLESIVEAYEEPFCDASMLPTTLLSHFTRQHVKVALSGDGADELFGGYYRYRVMHLLQALQWFPHTLRKYIAAALLNILPPKKEERTFWGRIRRLVELSDSAELEQYLRLISRCPEVLRHKIYGERMRDIRESSYEFLSHKYAKISTKILVDKIMELELTTYLLDDILTKVDRASMAHALEVRSPFLDPEVARLALQFPYPWKQQNFRRKRILVDTFADMLPPEVISRPKMGFGVPIARWLRQEWREKTRELLLEGSLVREGYFQRNRLSEICTAHNEGKADYSYLLFALIVLEIWFVKVHDAQ